jgi:hypothetical protein
VRGIKSGAKLGRSIYLSQSDYNKLHAQEEEETGLARLAADYIRSIPSNSLARPWGVGARPAKSVTKIQLVRSLSFTNVFSTVNPFFQVSVVRSLQGTAKPE